MDDKIQMKPLVRNLLAVRRQSGQLGKIGPVTFEPPINFLQRTMNDRQVKTCWTNHPVISFGDLHGDLVITLNLLRMGGLITSTGNWKGKNTVVVQVGDFIDRDGRSTTIDTQHNPREEMDVIQYLHALNIQANHYGGAVITVLGNHEITAVWLDNYPDYKEIHHNRNSLHMQGWGGSIQKRRLFQPGGLMARYLSIHCPLIVKVGNFIFMHGGITPKIAQRKSINALNLEVRHKLKTANSSQPSNDVLTVVFDRSLSDSPVKNTSYSVNCLIAVRKILKTWNLACSKGGIVVGHTIQSEIPCYCLGQVWRVDLGMSEAFGHSHKLGLIKIFQSVTASTIVNVIHKIRKRLKIQKFIVGKACV